MSTVLVTGGSGFVGSRCILQLLAAGHQVRTTVRSAKRAGDVRALLKEGGAEPGHRVVDRPAEAFALQVFVTDLESDGGWRDAVSGCEYVLHVASPFPSSVPKSEDELIVPAREGALRVLRAARDAGVRRVRISCVPQRGTTDVSRKGAEGPTSVRSRTAARYAVAWALRVPRGTCACGLGGAFIAVPPQAKPPSAASIDRAGSVERTRPRARTQAR